MGIGAPNSISRCRRFFLEPSSAKQRQYEALRAYFVDQRPSAEAARAFGYTPGSFQVMCHHFRREQTPCFFVSPQPGPRSQPKKSAAHDLIVELRKRNHSVYEISEILKSRNRGLSPTAVREVLKAEGFAALPRRLDEERPDRPRPTVEPVADVRQLSLTPRRFETACGGLLLFVPGMVALSLQRLAEAARLPGSKMIPASRGKAAFTSRGSWATAQPDSTRNSNLIWFSDSPRISSISPSNWQTKKTSSGCSGLGHTTPSMGNRSGGSPWPARESTSTRSRMQ